MKNNVAYNVSSKKTKPYNFRVLEINKKRKMIRKIYRTRMIFVSIVATLLGAFIMFIFNFLVGRALISQINFKLCMLLDEINEIKNVNSNREAVAFYENKKLREKISDFNIQKNINEDKVEIN